MDKMKPIKLLITSNYRWLGLNLVENFFKKERFLSDGISLTTCSGVLLNFCNVYLAESEMSHDLTFPGNMSLIQ